jgi:type IX secretion system PorP/SprF family membrane protein
LGAYLYNDQNGAIRRTGAQFTYSYHLFINNSQLSFGASLSMFQFKLNASQDDFYDQVHDPLLSERNSIIIPDANFGVYYKSFAYYVGFSAVQLAQSSLKFGDRTTSNFKMLRHYYLTGGYMFQLKRDYEIEPSVLLKTTENLTFQADFNVKGYYKQDYWVGFSYRTSGAIVGMLGFKYDKYQFGYAFDYSFNKMSQYSFGSHELMVGIKFGDNRRRYRWLNRF